MRRQRRPFFVSRFLLLKLVVGVLLWSSAACGGRPLPPLPPSSPEPSSKPDIVAAPESLPPELDVRIEPSAIRSGESALLSWEAENAEQVSINQNIGSVGVSGKIKFFPEETTTYTVSAEGSGGKVAKSVTVEVIAPGRVRLSGVDLSLESTEARFKYFVSPVFFEFNSARLSEEAKLTLEGNVQWLVRRENAHLRFVIEGHCDDQGTEEYNLALGDKRARVVKSYMVAKGIDSSRVGVISLGEERRFDPRRTEEGRALNRRAHFFLIQD